MTARGSIPKREIEMILEHVLQLSRATLIAHPERLLNDAQVSEVERLLARRESGEPMAYILGTRDFYNLTFHVTPDVLIPRPETEVLVEQALLRLSKAQARGPRLASNTAPVLDLGTGSGVIAISIAEQVPGAAVVATDVSTAALKVAQKNAQQCGVTIRFIESNWYEALEGTKFDLIVSNPPYVAWDDPHLTEGDLRYEPIGALTDGAPNGHGLACIRTIVDGAPLHLNDEGWLLFEHGYDQAPACASLLAARGFTSLICVPDLAGIPRVSGGKWQDQMANSASS
jgi:release factor glutamine methyltransferase